MKFTGGKVVTVAHYKEYLTKTINTMQKKMKEIESKDPDELLF